MRKHNTRLCILVTCMALSQPTYAQGWLDSVKGFFGLGEEQAEKTETMDTALSSLGLVKQITDSLGVTEPQAEGGLGSIFNYAKNNLSKNEFSQIVDALPGVKGLLSSMPDISELSSDEGIGGLLDKAASYNETAKAINNLNKQFEVLGLTPDQISGFVSSINRYLDTPQGQQAKQLLMSGLGQLLSQ